MKARPRCGRYNPPERAGRCDRSNLRIGLEGHLIFTRRSGNEHFSDGFRKEQYGVLSL